MDKGNSNNNKVIIIWTEGGKEIGMGHVCRCLVIAQELRKKGMDILFLVNDDLSAIDRIKGDDFPYEIASLSEVGLPKITSKSQTTILIDTKKPIADLIKQIKQIQPIEPKLILMDNTTPARWEADITIYPTAIFEKNLNGDGFKGKVFGGADYVPIAESYIRARQKAKHLKFRPPYQVLVTMGGSDPNHLTYKAVSSLLTLSEPINIKVVIGPAFSSDSHLNEIEKQGYSNIEFISHIEDLSLIMAESHIAITALGTTLYELASLGIPAVIITNYRADEKDMNAFKKLGIGLPLGFHGDVTDGDIRQAVEMLLKDRSLWGNMSQKGKTLIDGHGVEKIASIIVT